jgi:hypothetical protein
MLLQTVYVCTHALERWQERASPTATATEEEVIEAVRNSKRLGDDDFLPMPRKPNTHYYHSTEFNCYFVVEPIDLTSSRIVTVIVPGPPVNPVVSKKKQKVKPTPTVAALPPLKPPKPKPSENGHAGPKKLSLEEEYLALVKHITEIDYKLSGLTKKSSARKQLVDEKGKLHKRLLELKPVYQAWKRERADESNKNPFRSDGSLNYAGAILALMEKVQKLEAEVAQLRAMVKVTNQPSLPTDLLPLPHVRIAMEVLGEAQ